VLLRPILEKTLYEVFKGRRHVLTHLKVFGCKCFILNNGKEQPGKFQAKVVEGIFLGYDTNSDAYRVYNKMLTTVKEYMYVVFDESNFKLQDQVLNGADEEDIILENQFGAINE